MLTADNNKNAKDGRTVSGQKSSQVGTRNPEKASWAATERYIEGVNFPANKDDLINQSKRNQCSGRRYAYT